MRKRILGIAILVLSFSTAIGQNILINGDFETGVEDPWWVYINESNASAIFYFNENTANFTDITDVGENTYDLALIQDLTSDQIYEVEAYLFEVFQLSFEATVAEDRIVSIFFGEVEGNWTNLAGGGVFNLKPDQTEYKLTFTVPQVFEKMKLGIEIGTSSVPVEFDNIVLDLEPLGIEDGKVRNRSYSVYPNPASDLLTVKAENGSLVSLYSITGQLIRSNKVVDQSLEFDLSTMARGVYFVKILSEKEESIEKVIIR